MIRVIVKIGGGLCGINNYKILYQDIKENIQVGEFLTILSENVGDDVLKPTTVIVLNGAILSHNEIIESKLEDGDTISLFAAMVGG